MKIRPILRDDLASIKAIDQSTFAPEEQYGDETYEAMLESEWSKVAIQENLVVGYAFVQANPYMRIRSLAVHKDYRRRGYAKALLRALIREADNKVDLLVDEANEAAVALYESLGFERAEMCPIVPPKRRMVLKLRASDTRIQGSDVGLRPARENDRPFVETVYFGTHRWLTEKLFGWRGDDFERRKLSDSLDLTVTNIVLVGGNDAGWLMVRRAAEGISLEQIYLSPPWQNRGVGSLLIQQLIEEARAQGVPLRLSTAKINPARRLYERLGFVEVSRSEYKTYMEAR